MDSPKYQNFSISEATYKTVNDHNIKAFILQPKSLQPGNHPVIVKFHGGFFITGASLYPEWFPQWALDYALLHSAIIVAADYRLMPEATGQDLLHDVSDFWTWLRQDLQAHLAPGIVADHSKTIAYGESAGGYLAIHSGLTQPVGAVKAVIATYPIIDCDAKYEKPIFGAPALPPHILANFLASLVPGKIVTSAKPPKRMDLALSAVQQGRLKDFFGDGESLDLIKLIERTKNAEEVPFILILHGKDDSAVPIDGSIKFEEVVSKKFGGEKMELVLEPGEHGFDGEATLETPWLKKGLGKLTEIWL
ncbi:hypothetical protein B7494_g1365 [Chlorociboria aeruginascens]|nr:hypothetical protein B7494_g1365 [Chlorociboria aeruginascens]